MTESAVLKELRRVATFGAVGVSATGLFALLAGFFMHGMPLPVANGLAFIVSTAYAYLANAKLTFRRGHCYSSARRYALGALVGLTVSVITSALGQRFGLLGWWNIALVVFFVAPTNFLVHRLWTFHDRHYD